MGQDGGEVTPVTTLVSLLQIERFIPWLRRFELQLHDQALPEGPIDVPTVSGACFMMTRKSFQSLDGFDPAYFLHVEDIDLCWRVRQAGGRVVFHPHAEVVHIGQTSLVKPYIVEAHKGDGLIYFFKKRANTVWRKAYLFFLTPVIWAVARLRVILRKRKSD